MSNKIQKLDFLAGDIRLVKFTGMPNGNASEPLSFQRKVVSLRDTTDEYKRFSKARPENISSSQIFEQWVSRSYNHENRNRQKVSYNESFDAAAFKPRYCWGDFVATSYLWGSKSNLREIRLDGEAFYISQNLEEALRAGLKVCRAEIGRNLYFWNDMMCVNQDDKEEVDMALKQFSSIFSTAYSVNFWIGNEADDSTKVMELARTIDDDWESLKPGRMAMNPCGSGFFDVLGLRSELLEPYLSVLTNEQTWPALANFLARPYWKRLWIVQELVLANTTSLVMCGEASTSLISIWRLVRILNREKHLLRMFFAECQRLGWSRQVLQNTQRTLARLRYLADLSWASQKSLPSDLGRLIKVSRESQQKREQDKIYGLMGLIIPDVLNLLPVDSAKTPEMVYADFTRAYLQATRDANILKYCGISGTCKASETCSWSVNLLARRLSTSSLDNGIPFHAGGGNSASFDFRGGNLLRIRGYIIDRVKSTTISCASAPVPGSSNGEEIEYGQIPVHRYGSLSELRDAVWRTLVANRAYHSFSTSSESCKVLIEVPWTLKLTSSESEHHTQLTESLGLWADDLNHFRERTTDFDVFGHKLGSLFPTDVASGTDWPLVNQALLQMSRTLELRRFMTTSEGRLGICPEAAVCGDLVAVFPSCNEPIILREMASEDSDGSVYQVIGASYVDGVMEAQILNARQHELKEILLR